MLMFIRCFIFEQPMILLSVKYIVTLTTNMIYKYNILNCSKPKPSLHITPEYRTYTQELRCRDRMVVGFTTTYAISAFHHYCCDFDTIKQTNTKTFYKNKPARVCTKLPYIDNRFTKCNFYQIRP